MRQAFRRGSDSFARLDNFILMLHYIQRLSEEPRPFRFLASRLLWRSGLCTGLRIVKQGYELRFYPSSLSAELWFDPEARQGDEMFLRGYLRPDDVMIDVGANIGDLTLCASTLVGDNGRVYAFEPHPRIYRFLMGNIALNGRHNVETFNAALGESRGAVHFSSGRSDDQNSVLTGGSGIEVPLIPLDELPLGEKEIALLKVDVEGYEKFVFSGATETLRHVRCVYFESWERHFAKFRYRLQDLLDLLQDAGFQVFRQIAVGMLSAVEDDCSEHCENLIAVRDPAEFASRSGYRFESLVSGGASSGSG